MFDLKFNNNYKGGGVGIFFCFFGKVWNSRAMKSLDFRWTSFLMYLCLRGLFVIMTGWFFIFFLKTKVSQWRKALSMDFQ